MKRVIIPIFIGMLSCLWILSVYAGVKNNPPVSMVELQWPVAMDAPVTRGVFVKVINDCFSYYTAVGYEFPDIPSDSPSYFDFMTAQRAGYIIGDEKGNGNPDKPISRAEAAVALAKILALDSGQASLYDRDMIPDWALDAVNACVSEGIFTGDDSFRPFDPLSGEEFYDIIAGIIEAGSNVRFLNEWMAIESYDGYKLTGRLSIPGSAEEIKKLIINVNSSGPHTCINEVGGPNFRYRYYDFFGEEFCKQGAAFFTYNTRGVEIIEEPPYYRINEGGYVNYRPSVQIQDIQVMLDTLRADPRFKDTSVYLFGWSEGAVIAPLAVLEQELEVDGLILAGYPNMNMKGIVEWQLSGASSLINYQLYFKAADKNRITPEEFALDPYGMAASLGVTFEDLDLDRNRVIEKEDFALLLGDYKEQLFAAIEGDDDQWIKENYSVQLTSVWFKEHFALPPTEDILAQLSIPIYAFHGEYDGNCPVEGVYDLKARFEQEGKDNLTVQTFDLHNHDLNITNLIYSGAMPEGIQAIFDTVSALK